MKNTITLFILACLSVTACETCTTESIDILTWNLGRNDYTEQIDGEDRDFIVHVPASYDGNTPLPVVMMLHGSGGTGDRFHDISQWVETGEDEDIITVFPTALEYTLLDGTIQTKWSSDGLDQAIMAGQTIKDDIIFIEEMMALITATFNVDEQRVYVSGFSNGGGFVKSEIVPRLGHLFAAASTSGGPGIPVISTIDGDRIMPVFNISGSMDDRIWANVGANVELPLPAADIEAHTYLWGNLTIMCEMLELDTIYREERFNPEYNLMHFEDGLGARSSSYVFMMAKELQHRYPNGTNNPRGVVAADVLWPWYLQHTLQ